MDWLFIPVAEFDKYLKRFKTIKSIFKTIFSYILPHLDFLIIKTNLLYYVLWIIPRLILLIALYIDVFIYNQLHYKYIVVLFGLLLFINRYFKYSLKMYKKELMEDGTFYISTILTDYVPRIHPAELEPDYDPNDPDEDEYTELMYIPFETFIKFQTESIIYLGITRRIVGRPSITWVARLYYWEKYIDRKSVV